MCNTTGQGECLISHNRSWLVGPGTPPVMLNSKSSTSLGSGGEETSDGLGVGGQTRPGLYWLSLVSGRSPSSSQGTVDPSQPRLPVPMNPVQGSTSMM